MESQHYHSEHYHYRVSRLNEEHTTPMAGDSFKFSIRVSSYSMDADMMNTGTERLLYYSPSQCIPCHHFFQEGQHFLSTLLSRIHFSINDSLEELARGVMSAVQDFFQVDQVASPSPSFQSQHREIPLRLEILQLYDGISAAMEESMQCFKMIPASNEAIQTLLKKSTVVMGSEGCPICLEELDVNAECCTMPCHHVFHLQCIVTWLKTSHVCPLCRYPLPTLKN
ncbi:E3 ubiquitin-protein ligase DMA2-like [Cajanus cajan]|uniref:E3 ubiquitin-protein ligase DMA2-like n=1 Tax=Cajanus cajan TaxID=3821 RepID=UPI00098D9B31|nr:E3 ubiquitin-protein ligase DMA2-like [Cajanus cajan]